MLIIIIRNTWCIYHWLQEYISFNKTILDKF